MKGSARPSRTMRHEATFVCLVFAIPAIAAAVFPYGAFSFSPADRPEAEDTAFAYKRHSAVHCGHSKQLCGISSVPAL